MSNQEQASTQLDATAVASGAAGMTGGELAEAKRYGRLELVCTLVDKAVDAVYLAVAALLLARPLDAWLQTYPLLEENWSLRLTALFLIVTGLHVAASFPLSFYSGHVLEHKFQLSTQTFGRWLWRYAKRNLLAVALSLGVALGLYWLIWTIGGWWWLAAAGAFFVVSVVLGQLTPVLILPLFYRIEKLDEPELTERISRLAEGTGLSIEGVYRMDLSAETVKANAMLAGLGHTRRVLLGDTLFDGFQPDEIEVIFAHEIGHHVFRHIWKIMVAGLFYSAAGFWVCDRLLAAWVARQGAPINYAELPVYTLPLMLLILTLLAMLIEPLQ
ncbi:MAG: M48 family metalloprotease, partial [Planctomycetes bacterium]|nr:M48 family metalloprotease [Planctomycetota bacterium]